MKYWIKVILNEVYYRISNILRPNKDKSSAESINLLYEKIEDRKWVYYRKLIKKYPKMIWAKKYIKSGDFLAIKGLVALNARDQLGLKTIWTYEASLEDVVFILSIGETFISEIYLDNKSPHCISVLQLNPKKSKVWFLDTLGHYNSNYRYKYQKCFMTINDFMHLNTGKPIFVSVSLPLNHPNYNIIKRRLYTYKHYEI